LHNEHYKEVVIKPRKHFPARFTFDEAIRIHKLVEKALKEESVNIEIR